MELRPYQRECLEVIHALPPGACLVQMATGLGKTATFAHLERRGRTLILSHREELVRQPQRYYTCSVGVEQGKSRANGEEVVSASVATLTRRLGRSDPEEFDTIICDEAHHAAATSYRRIFDWFKPRLLLGFTATPNRGDRVRLDDIFSRIVFQRDLRWGIENGYLCDILCKRVNIGYDLSAVRTRYGDYAPGELEEAMEGTAGAVAQAYRERAVGATIIFAVSVRHANEIAALIPGAAVITGETKDRAAILDAFTAGEIPCIVNCMVLTEGTDLPRVETVMIARPTQSESLYCQMVGRGLRLYPGKERLTLIDCVGVTGKANLCTAPSLLGVDLSNVPPRRRDELDGLIFELPAKAAMASDCPESWIRNVEIVDLWAMEQGYNTHDVAWFKLPDGSLVCALPKNKKITIPCPDALGMTVMGGKRVGMQEALDMAYSRLCGEFRNARTIWDLRSAKRWGRAPATAKQLAFIARRCRGFDAAGLTKLQASHIINRLKEGGGIRGRK